MMALGWFALEAPEPLKVVAFCAVPTVGFWASTGLFLHRYNKWYTRKRPDRPEEDDLAETMKLVNVTTRNISIGFASYMVWKECGYSFEEAATPLTTYAALLATYWTYHPLLLGLGWTRWGVWHSSMTTVAAATTLVMFWRVFQPAGVSMIPFFFLIATTTIHNWREASRKTSNESSLK